MNVIERTLTLLRTCRDVIAAVAGPRIPCAHQNGRERRWISTDDSTPMMTFDCPDCGYHDSGHVHADPETWLTPDTAHDRPTPIQVVHYLIAGRALCGLTGPPNLWPTGHCWVGPGDADEGSVTCAGCQQGLLLRQITKAR